MSRGFFVNEGLDPRDLAINLRFKGRQILHPRVREAQEALTILVKQAIMDEDSYDPCDDCLVKITYGFPTRASDIDGPLKRTLDCIEKAHKALGYKWNDNRITKLTVTKTGGWSGIILAMEQREGR